MNEERYISVEVDGIPVTIDREALADIDLLDNLYDVQNGDPTAIVPIVRAMFGREQWDNVRATLKADGRGHFEGMFKFIGDAMNAAAEGVGDDVKN